MLSVRCFASAAVTVTLSDRTEIGAPLMTPVDASMVSPSGRPVADHVNGAVPPLADIVRLAASPTVPDCGPGSVIDTGAAITQANEAVPARLAASVAFTV